MPTTQLTPGTNVTVDFSGLDSGGNPAAVNTPTVDISDHSKAYAVLFSPTRAIVVARGPLGNYNFLLNAKDADGNDVPTLSLPFSTVAGDAKSFSIAIGTPTPDDITTPGIPAGW